MSSSELIYNDKLSINIWDLYLNKEIEEADEFIEIYHTLRSKVEQNDHVNLYLNSVGGSCSTLMSLVNAVKACAAPVNMVVTAPCYSAGASLALCGKTLTMEDNTFLMFHNYSGGAAGKGDDILDSAVNHRKWVYEYFRDIHMPFLTRKECDSIEQNKDLYIHANDKDLEKRIKRHFGEGEK